MAHDRVFGDSFVEESRMENWKDVKKELPTEWGNYLVMADEMDVMTFYPDAPDLWSSWQARGHKSGGDVTHWMKLPNKPQTE